MSVLQVGMNTVFPQNFRIFFGVLRFRNLIFHGNTRVRVYHPLKARCNCCSPNFLSRNPPAGGLRSPGLEVLSAGFEEGVDNVNFFLGPLVVLLRGLLFLGDGDDFVNGN